MVRKGDGRRGVREEQGVPRTVVDKPDREERLQCRCQRRDSRGDLRVVQSGEFWKNSPAMSLRMSLLYEVVLWRTCPDRASARPQTSEKRCAGMIVV